MDELNKYRKKIDDIDLKIMELLSERLNITQEIGKYKIINNLNTVDEKRENSILKLTNKYKNNKYLKNIYQEIFKNSKTIQEYKYFLVGKSLDYSFSPAIYEMLGIENYNLFPTLNFSDIKNINFHGINITNPYKYNAYSLCDELDLTAINTGVVNTIIRKETKLIGYNTDDFGFRKLLDYNKVEVKNKKIIIIGNGATAKTIKSVLEKKDVKRIIHLVRNVHNEEEYEISKYNDFLDFEIIINATPYGTYPNNELKPLFNLEGYQNLEALIDVVYNPRSTPLLLFNKQGIKKIDGLIMLVAQAAMAASLYTNTDKTYLIENIYKNLNLQLCNIVLIGMPFSGKSRLGKLLANKLENELIDLDEVMQANKHDLKSVLEIHNLTYFRKLEEEYAIKYAKERSKIISTGGGIIYSDLAMNYLKQNGIIIFLDSKFKELLGRMDDTRPLIKNKEDLEKIYLERISLYRKYSDIIVNSDFDIDELVEKINEYLNN